MFLFLLLLEGENTEGLELGPLLVGTLEGCAMAFTGLAVDSETLCFVVGEAAVLKIHHEGHAINAQRL